MKKAIFIFTFILFCIGVSFAQTGTKKIIKDGLYLISREGTDTTQFDSLKINDIVIGFNYLVIAKNDQKFSRIVIDTSEYVPLELEKLPSAEQQTDIKKKLMFSLTKEAAEKLKTFTSTHIMKKVALVVGGEAVSIHKIREPIANGQLQITTCSDNACESLIVKMKSDVKK